MGSPTDLNMHMQITFLASFTFWHQFEQFYALSLPLKLYFLTKSCKKSIGKLHNKAIYS